MTDTKSYLIWEALHTKAYAVPDIVKEFEISRVYANHLINRWRAASNKAQSRLTITEWEFNRTQYRARYMYLINTPDAKRPKAKHTEWYHGSKALRD